MLCAVSRPEAGLSSEPARDPTLPKTRFLRDESRRWVLKGARWFRPAQEIDVHAADLVVAELDVARALAFVRLRRRAVLDLRNDRRRDDFRRALGEHAGLWRADTVDIAGGIDPGKLRRQRLLVHGHPVIRMRGQPRVDDDLRDAVDGED